MKFLLFLVVVLVAVFAWRKGRERRAGRSGQRPQPSKSADAKPEPTAAAQEMLSCPVCGVHLPRSEALIGRNGAYCSAAHRQQGEA